MAITLNYFRHSSGGNDPNTRDNPTKEFTKISVYYARKYLDKTFTLFTSS